MKRTIYSIALSLAVIMASSCKKFDNYDGPDQTLQGRIIDINNGRNVQSEVSGDNGAGTRIRLLEISWSDNPTPLLLATKQDGTYINTKVFAATYKISAEGAFVPLVQPGNDKSQTIEVKGGTTTVDFTVEPMLEVEWVGEPVLNPDGTVTAQVKVTRGTTNPNFQNNITDLWLFVSPSEYVGNNNYDNRFAQQLPYSGSTFNANLGTTITIKTKGGALPKKDWYFRLGARTNYGLKQYNYSDIKKVVVQ